MADPFGVDDVLRGKPSPGTLLRRGFAKRCPRCGGRNIFETWFRMRDRCPRCGYLFEREPGFFIGSFFINFLIAEGFIFVLAMAFVWWKTGHADAGVLWPAVVGVIVAVLAPIVFYPYSRTIWSAFDLMMIPLEVSEIVAAADAVRDDDAPSTGDLPPDDLTGPPA